MVTTVTGQAAEAAVTKFLESDGYEIVARNWKTPVCEIDIVAKKDDVIYFVEVKYRASQNQGSGWEYITKKKLEQMNFATRVWSKDNNCNGDMRLLAAEVSGPEFEKIEITEISG